MVALNINSKTNTAGNIYPFSFFISTFFSREYPLFKKKVPVAIPARSPINPIYALESPADIRIIILKGHPKNTSAPIIIATPAKNLITGDEPPVALYSFVKLEIIKDPKTNPTISGLKYWTTAAV